MGIAFSPEDANILQFTCLRPLIRNEQEAKDFLKWLPNKVETYRPKELKEQFNKFRQEAKNEHTKTTI